MTNTTISTASKIDDEDLVNQAESANVGLLADLIDADLEQVVGAEHASAHLSAIY